VSCLSSTNRFRYIETLGYFAFVQTVLYQRSTLTQSNFSVTSHYAASLTSRRPGTSLRPPTPHVLIRKSCLLGNHCSIVWVAPIVVSVDTRSHRGIRRRPRDEQCHFHFGSTRFTFTTRINESHGEFRFFLNVGNVYDVEDCLRLLQGLGSKRFTRSGELMPG